MPNIEINYVLNVYRLFDRRTGKVFVKKIWLSEYEVQTLNYAYALNGMSLRYEKV